MGILLSSALFAILLCACSKEPVGVALSKMRSGEYLQSVESGSHTLQVYYLPRDLQLLRRGAVDTAALLTENMLDSLEHIYGQVGLAFMLRIDSKSSDSGAGIGNDLIYGENSGYPNYQEAQKAYQIGLKEKIWLESDEGTLPLSLYWMENTFGMDPGRSFMLMFGAPLLLDGRGET